MSPSAYWFITRGTGAIALVLLTLSVALGVADIRHAPGGRLPRFVVDAVHRSASLLAVAFVAVHVVTSVLDGFAPLSLLDGVIPFLSPYRPLWLSLGAISFDLMLAVTITSLLRQRLGYRAWRITHWLAYASWPVALIHGFGTGTDARTHWMLLLSIGCIAVVLAAVVARVSAGWPGHLGIRVSALGVATALPVGLLVWLPSGPLAAGWARRAGTPASLLTAAHGAPVAATASGGSAGSGSSGSGSSGSGTSGGGSSGGAPVSASLAGNLREAGLPGGQALLDLELTSSNAQLHHLMIRIRGQAMPNGGVQLGSSRVALGPEANPDQYDGRVVGLQGTTIQATVTDAGGSTLQLVAQLSVAPGSNEVSGTLTATPGAGR